MCTAQLPTGARSWSNPMLLRKMLGKAHGDPLDSLHTKRGNSCTCSTPCVTQLSQLQPRCPRGGGFTWLRFQRFKPGSPGPRQTPWREGTVEEAAQLTAAGSRETGEGAGERTDPSRAQPRDLLPPSCPPPAGHPAPIDDCTTGPSPRSEPSDPTSPGTKPSAQELPGTVQLQPHGGGALTHTAAREANLESRYS